MVLHSAPLSGGGLFSVPPAGGAGKGELHSQARLQFLRKFRILCSQLPVLRRFNGNLGLRVLLNLAQPFDTGGGSGIHRELLVTKNRAGVLRPYWYRARVVILRLRK